MCGPHFFVTIEKLVFFLIRQTLRGKRKKMGAALKHFSISKIIIVTILINLFSRFRPLWHTFISQHPLLETQRCMNRNVVEIRAPIRAF
jgi:hypothetical protein